MGQKGFTYIELLITLSILAILASVIMPLAQLSYKRAKEAELKQYLRIIRTAIDQYKSAWDEGRIKRISGESGYPSNLNILIEGVDDASSPQSGKKIRFLRRIPRDPMNQDETLQPEKTWGLRSYQSSPENPREGDDVFDIYSLSNEQAINGTYYKEW